MFLGSRTRHVLKNNFGTHKRIDRKQPKLMPGKPRPCEKPISTESPTRREGIDPNWKHNSQSKPTSWQYPLDRRRGVQNVSNHISRANQWVIGLKLFAQIVFRAYQGVQGSIIAPRDPSRKPPCNSVFLHHSLSPINVYFHCRRGTSSANYRNRSGSIRSILTKRKAMQSLSPEFVIRLVRSSRVFN